MISVKYIVSCNDGTPGIYITVNFVWYQLEIYSAFAFRPFLCLTVYPPVFLKSKSVKRLTLRGR